MSSFWSSMRDRVSQRNLDVKRKSVQLHYSGVQHGGTLLHKLAATGDVDTLERLVRELRRNGDLAPIDQQDERGWTPLASACNAKQFESIRILVKHGASASLPCSEGHTPVHLLCAQVPNEKEKKAYKKALRLMLTGDALTAVHDLKQRVVETELHVAADRWNLVAAKILLEKCSDYTYVNATAPKLGWTPLHFAAKHGNRPLLDLLLNAGANPYIEAEVLGSARDVAQCARHEQIADHLSKLMHVGQETLGLALKADYNKWMARIDANPNELRVANDEGVTCLHHFCRIGQRGMLDWTLNHPAFKQNGSYVNVQDQTGRTALHYCAERGDIASIEALLEAGADPARTSHGGTTLLHLVPLRLKGEQYRAATDAQTVEAFVSAALSSGADVNARDVLGETPLMKACAKGDLVYVKRLCAEASLDLNARHPITAENALPYAVRGGNKEVVIYLAEQGADVDGIAPSAQPKLLKSLPNARHASMALTMEAASARRLQNAHDFPDEVLSSVFKECNAKDLAALSLTCSRFRDVLLLRDEIWREVVQRQRIGHIQSFQQLCSLHTWLLVERRATPTISFRVLVVGDKGVGSSSLVQRFCWDVYPCVGTADEEVYTRNVHTKDNQLCHLELALPSVPEAGSGGPARRPANMDALREMVSMDKVDGMLLLFDSRKPATYNSLQAWEEAVRLVCADSREGASPPAVFVAGTFSDKRMKVDPSALVASPWQPVFLTSALDQTNVHALFKHILDTLMRRQHSRKRTRALTDRVRLVLAEEDKEEEEKEKEKEKEKSGNESRRAAFARKMSSKLLGRTSDRNLSTSTVSVEASSAESSADSGAAGSSSASGAKPARRKRSFTGGLAKKMSIKNFSRGDATPPVMENGTSSTGKRRNRSQSLRSLRGSERDTGDNSDESSSTS